MGEFDGITDKIDDDLRYFCRIAHNLGRDLRIDIDPEFDPFFRCSRSIGFDRRFNLFYRVECNMFQLDLVGLDLGEVKNVIHNGQQILGTVFNDSNEFTLFIIQFGIFQELGKSDDPVQRCTDLV